MLTALLQRGWIKPGDGGHLLTDAGYAAIGQQRPVPKMTSSRWLPLTTSNFWRASLCARVPSLPRWWWRCAARRGNQPATDAGHRLAAAHGARRDFRDVAKETGPERGAGPQRIRRAGVSSDLIITAGSEFSSRPCRKGLQILDTLGGRFHVTGVQTCEPGTHRGSHLLCPHYPAHASTDTASGPSASSPGANRKPCKPRFLVGR